MILRGAKTRERGGNPTGCAHREVRGLVDMAPNLDQVEEDCRVDWARARGVVVCIRKGLENIGRQLEPWTVEGRDVTPVSASGELMRRSKGTWHVAESSNEGSCQEKDLAAMASHGTNSGANTPGNWVRTCCDI